MVQGRGVTNDYVIVSAPGRSGERGAVYVYTFSDSEQTWSMLQSITSELWSLGEDDATVLLVMVQCRATRY